MGSRMYVRLRIYLRGIGRKVNDINVKPVLRSLSPINRRLTRQYHQLLKRHTQNNQLLQWLLRTSVEGIAIVSEGEVVQHNQRFSELTGYGNERRHKLLLDGDKIKEDTVLNKILDECALIERNGSIVTRNRDFQCARDGEKRGMFLQARFEKYVHLDRPAVAVVITDISEQLHHDQSIQNEKLRALGAMAGGVAHDFNNILGGILGAVGLFKEEHPELAEDELLAKIEAIAQDGAEIVKRIQDYSRVRKDRPHDPVNLKLILEDALLITRPRWKDLAQRENIQYAIHKNIPDGLYVLGDASALREVFTNIFINAFDAMPSGGKLTILTEKQENTLLISVSDTGVGMPEKTRQRAFDPFYTTKGPNNTGLGLSVTYGIIKRHDGQVDILSEVNRGTTLYITLPTAGEVERTNGLHRDHRKNGRNNVLIIDDNATISDLLVRALEPHGYKVYTSSNAKDGLTLFEQEPVDLVITDLSMPDMSGYEIAGRIKERRAHVPVFLMTGWAYQVDDKSLKENGIDRVIPKTMPIKKIRQLVTQTLQGDDVVIMAN